MFYSICDCDEALKRSLSAVKLAEHCVSVFDEGRRPSQSRIDHMVGCLHHPTLSTERTLLLPDKTFLQRSRSVVCAGVKGQQTNSDV